MGEAIAHSEPGVPSVGDVLDGKYRIERVVGRGGMGTVVEAVHLTLHQRVAVKFMLPAFATDPALVERFMREARATARLRGDHVARILDVGQLPNRSPYLVMEFLEGNDLRHLVAQGPLSLEEAVTYIREAAEGVAEAHLAGVVHRDIKPANLFIARTALGRASVKVLDFGVAKLVGDDVEGGEQGLTRTALVLGSPKYIAPEQLRSSKTADARADVWALGVCLYQCLTGRAPFETNAGIGALGAMILTSPPPPLATFRPDVPDDLARIVGICLEKDPRCRFPDAGALAAALDVVAKAHGYAVFAESRKVRTSAAPPDVSASQISASQSNVSYGSRSVGSMAPSYPSASASYVAERQATTRPPPGHGALWLGVAVALVVGVGGGGGLVWWITTRDAEPPVLESGVPQRPIPTTAVKPQAPSTAVTAPPTRR